MQDNTQKLKILVVDDVSSNRVLLQTMFEDIYKVYEAENGETALSLLNRHRDVSAVLLDIVMPMLDGNGVLEMMRCDVELRDIPVLVITGCDDEKSQIRALELGAIDVIVKPFNPLVVRARVKNAVDRRIAQQKAKESELLKFKLEQQQRELGKSRYDELTGLYGKQFFNNVVRLTLDEHPNKDYVLVRFDLDRFKVYNDIFSAAKGDELLSDIGRMISEKWNDALFIGRVEADHFIGLFEKDSFDKSRLLTELTTLLDGYPIRFEFSLKAGVYEIDDKSVDPRVMCDRALLALRSVKSLAGAQIGFYDDSLRQRLLDEQELLSDMSAAFEREEFKLWFQPQYDYPRGKMIGAEALVRWQHPTRGLISPGQFIPIMETNGLITRLDEYVWERACAFIRRWLNIRPSITDELPPISVNISRADVLHPDLAGILTRLTEKYDVPHSLLNLEITESAYMEDSELLLAAVEKLRSLGFTLEMDDFGAGYSSLNTLKDVPVDILKLDMKFVSGAQYTSRGGNILSSVIRMTRWLNIPVIAEGVETQELADYLKSIGCRFMQGYLFARPMPAEQFEPIYLNTVRNAKCQLRKFDMSQAELFWNASNQTALIFNSFLGGAAILEYGNGNVELLRANDRYFELLGTTRNDYEQWSTHIQDRFEEGYAYLFTNELDEAARTGAEVTLETLSQPINGGEPIWIRNSVRFLARSADSQIFYVGIENITKSKLDERELQKQDALLKSLYDAIPNGVLRFRLNDGSLSLISCNKVSWQTLGYKSEQEFFDGGELQMLSNVYPDDRSPFEALLSRVVRDAAGGDAELEHRFTLQNGETRWAHTTFQKIDTATGETFIQCVYSDITARKEAETLKYGKLLLGYFNELFEVDFVRMTYTQIGTFGNIITETKGKNALDNLLEQRINKLVHPYDRSRLIELCNQIEKERPYSIDELPRMDYRILMTNGEIGWHSLLLMCLDSGRYLCCITDISEQKRLEQLSSDNARQLAEERERRAEMGRNRLLLETLGCSVLDYNAMTDVLECWCTRDGKPVNFLISSYSYPNLESRFLNAEDIDTLRAAIIEAQKSPRIGELEFFSALTGVKRMNRFKYISLADETGKVYRILGISQDIQSELEQSSILRELNAENTKFGIRRKTTVPELLFTLLCDAEDEDAAIRSVLSVIGRQLDVSRAYVVENAPDGMTGSDTYEWFSETVSSKIKTMQNVPYPVKYAGHSEDLFDINGMFAHSDVARLDESLRAMLEKRGVRAVARSGMWIKGRLIGFVGFDECRCTRSWSNEHLKTLSLAGAFIAALISKKHESTNRKPF